MDNQSFIPEDAKLGNLQAMNAGDIKQYIEMLGSKATDSMCNIVDEIENLLSTMFVGSENADNLKAMFDDLKKSIHHENPEKVIAAGNDLEQLLGLMFDSLKQKVEA